MVKRKLILICQSGGEFQTNEDKTLSYAGGEANAININDETQFEDLKLKLAETCDLDSNSVSVKYFLPGNKRNLITLKNDKDLNKLIDYHGNSVTADIFVSGTKGFIRDALTAYTSREDDIKLAETVNRAVVPKITRKSTRAKGAKRAGRKVVPARRKTPAAPVAPASPVAPADSVTADDAVAQSSSEATTDSSPSSDNDVDDDFNYAPRTKIAAATVPNVPTEVDKTSTPADTVKKRRRTASWKFGVNGPTIVSVPDDDEERDEMKEGRSQKRNRQSPDSAAVSGKVKRNRDARNRRSTSSVAVSGSMKRKRGTEPAKSSRIVEKAREPAKSRRFIEKDREKLQDSYEESYGKLPWFCEKVMVTNPGSSAKLLTNDDKRFQRLFVYFHATIGGFLDSCRPLIFLEATSFKSVYDESLLTATAVDADDGFFPLAFAIVDCENDDNWYWFLELLKSAVSTPQSITFISDREKNLKKPVLEVFENAHHGYSMFHLIENMNEKLKGPFHGEGKGALPGKLLDAAHAVRFTQFTKFTEQIKQISSEAYDWVMQVEPEYWTSLSFKGEPYNHFIQDVGELYIKLMEEVEELPIIQKIQALIHMMSDLINARRMDSSMWSSTLTPSKEKKLVEENLRVRGLKVFISSDTLFEVHDDSVLVVNTNNWECSCLEWKRSGLPCRHAIAVFNRTNRSVYDYCPKYFTADTFRLTYSESINPVGDIGTPLGKEEAEAVHVIPPCSLQPVAEQKKEQIKSVKARKRTVICSKCKAVGHNKSSCRAVEVRTIEVCNADSSIGNPKDEEVEPCKEDSAGSNRENTKAANEEPCEVDNAGSNHDNSIDAVVQPCEVDKAGSIDGNPEAVNVQPREVGDAGSRQENLEAVEVQPCKVGSAGCEVDKVGSIHGSPEAVEVQPCEVDNAGSGQGNAEAIEVQPCEVDNAGSGQENAEATEVQPCAVSNAGLDNEGSIHDHSEAVEAQP